MDILYKKSSEVLAIIGKLSLASNDNLIKSIVFFAAILLIFVGAVLLFFSKTQIRPWQKR